MQTITVRNRPFFTSFLRNNDIKYGVISGNRVTLTTDIDLLNLVAMFHKFTQEVLADCNEN